MRVDETREGGPGGSRVSVQSTGRLAPFRYFFNGLPVGVLVGVAAIQETLSTENVQSGIIEFISSMIV